MIEGERGSFPAFFYDNECLDEAIKDLFCKCVYLPDDLEVEISDGFQHSFAICKEVLDFLATNIFDNDPNNKLIELLKKNFLEFFYLERESDLSEKSINFRTFKEILVKSINQLKSIENQQSQLNRNSYFCNRKLKNLKYSLSCYDNLSSIHDNKLDNNLKLKTANEFAKIRLSNKSLSLSDNELNQSCEFEVFGTSLKVELNRTKCELADLKSENFKLRDQIEILRDQLLLAEDTNSQIGTELENQNRIINEQLKKSTDFQSKILFYEKDIEDLRITNDDLKIKMCILNDQNLNLNKMLEENSCLITDKDRQLAKIIDENQNTIQNFVKQLDEQKKINDDLQSANSKLNKKNVEFESKISHFEETISKLYWNNKELKIEVDMLREKCSILENETENNQNKILINEYPTSQENKENIMPKCSSFQENKTNFPKKSQKKKELFQPFENLDENIDSKLSKTFCSDLDNSTLKPNVNSFMLEQIESDLNKKEFENYNFEVLADFFHNFLIYIDSIKKQHEELICKSDVLNMIDSNNNKTPETKKSLHLKEQLFNHLIIKGHNEFKSNLEKFIDQSKNYFEMFQSLSIKNSIQNYNSIGKSMSLTNLGTKTELVAHDRELSEKNAQLPSTFSLSQCDQFEYFLVSSPPENVRLGTLNSTENSEDQCFDQSQETTIADDSKNNSVNEKRRNNFNSFSRNLTNIQINTDLINSNLIRNNLDCSESEVNMVDSSKFFNSKKRFQIGKFFVSNYRKLRTTIRKNPLKFFKTTFSILILGFSVIFFLITITRDDLLMRELIKLLSSFFEIKNPFDSLRAN